MVKIVKPELCIMCSREFTYSKIKAVSENTGLVLRQRPLNTITCCKECAKNRYVQRINRIVK